VHYIAKFQWDGLLGLVCAELIGTKKASLLLSSLHVLIQLWGHSALAALLCFH
jgi:hypothetical protein